MSVTPRTGHATASVNGTPVAETTSWEEVEGNVYFPPGAVKRELLSDTSLHTHCPWKGDASYYSVAAGGETVENAAWYYPEPLAKAKDIKDFVAFDKRKAVITVD